MAAGGLIVKNLVNFIGFQAVWFCSVLGASRGNHWLPPLATLAFVSIHFALSPARRADGLLVAVALPLGVALATAWSALGLFQYRSQLLPPLAPAWIACLWICFSLTLNHSLAWMQKHLALAAALAAGASPLSYYGAQKLGAVAWLSPVGGFAAVSVSWMLIVPLLLRLAMRFTAARPAGARTHALA